MSIFYVYPMVPMHNTAMHKYNTFSFLGEWTMTTTITVSWQQLSLVTTNLWNCLGFFGYFNACGILFCWDQFRKLSLLMKFFFYFYFSCYEIIYFKSMNSGVLIFLFLHACYIFCMLYYPTLSNYIFYILYMVITLVSFFPFVSGKSTSTSGSMLLTNDFCLSNDAYSMH